MSDTPEVYQADALPRRQSEPRLTFRFDAGEVRLSIALYRLMNVADSRRVVFVEYKGGWYITRVDRGGFWLNVSQRPKGDPYSVSITAKAFVRQTLRSMGHGAGENVTFPVTEQSIGAADVLLDPAEYSYPFYHLVVDQKTVKS